MSCHVDYVYTLCVSLSLSVALQVFLQSFLLQFGSLPLVQSFLDVWPLRPLIVWYSHIITSLHVQTNNIGVHAPPQALMKRPETRVQQYTVHHPHLTQKCRGAQWRDTHTHGGTWGALLAGDSSAGQTCPRAYIRYYVVIGIEVVVVYNICETGIQGEHQEQRTLPNYSS